VSGLSRRSAIIAGGTTVAGVLAGGGILLSDSQSQGTKNDVSGAEISGPVASATIPPNPADYQYAAMGTGDSDTTVTYFGSWKCPYCARFSTGFLQDIVEDYVATGDINIQYRNISYLGGEPFLGRDAPNAGHAGLAVWNSAPDAYWQFHEYIFQNQPPEGRQWATASKLASFAQASGVENPQPIKEAVRSNTYENALRATSDAATSAGVRGTPSLLVDGTLVSPFEKQQTRQTIENAISG
jgi:protein-disulfide isomerase